MKLPVRKFLTFLIPVIACALVPVFVHNDYLMQVFFRIILFAALGLAWNLVGGYAGQLSLGHVAFFGVGAYGLAMFTARGVPVWISIFLAAAAATGFAAVIGLIVFRLRGPYFTLSTIAFAEVLRLGAANLTATGGAIGLSTPALFRPRTFFETHLLSTVQQFYLAAVTLAAVCFVINYATSKSRPGYYLMAIREDEETAAAVGISTAGYKLRALLISAFLTALGGALYGSAFQYIVPDSALSIEISVQMAIITMLGGAGTLLGPVIGAILLLGASEVFKNRFQESHLLIYGILIVVVVLFLPEGIVGGLRHLFRRGMKSKPPSSVAQSPAVAEAKGGN
ncbi:MAG TPA: branched-chain amino acid ABC transporter permease [Candidatus Angelobacter sp.]|nr:branched-chain amino acid ABC transporter permease [Candidatus Angelobacter sp.]